jgi:hypothetical protein
MGDLEDHVQHYPTSYAAQGALSPDGKGGWYMKRVGAAGAPAPGQPVPTTKFADVQKSLEDGTVVLNSAGSYLAPLASVTLATLEALQLPIGLNLYVTNPGMTLSAPPHTDKQDVFVLQSQGSKHWRVFAPPEPKARLGADPFARGKGPDALTLEELGPPLIEADLTEGQLLYIPAGFPHTTDTSSDACKDRASIHLTIGADTHIWGLTYSSLRHAALARFPPRPRHAAAPGLPTRRTGSLPERGRCIRVPAAR